MMNTVYHSIALYCRKTKCKAVVIIVICNLFNFCTPEHITPNDSDDCKLWMAKYVEGSVQNLIQGAILAMTWTDWCKSQNTSINYRTLS